MGSRPSSENRPSGDALGAEKGVTTAAIQTSRHTLSITHTRAGRGHAIVPRFDVTRTRRCAVLRGPSLSRRGRCVACRGNHTTTSQTAGPGGRRASTPCLHAPRGAPGPHSTPLHTVPQVPRVRAASAEPDRATAEPRGPRNWFLGRARRPVLPVPTSRPICLGSRRLPTACAPARGDRRRLQDRNGTELYRAAASARRRRKKKCRTTTTAATRTRHESAPRRHANPA